MAAAIHVKAAVGVTRNRMLHLSTLKVAIVSILLVAIIVTVRPDSEFIQLEALLETQDLPMSAPPSQTATVSFTRYVCCHCLDRGASTSKFFGTRQAVEVHIGPSRACQAAGKGVKIISAEYRPSKRVEDHEAGPVG